MPKRLRNKKHWNAWAAPAFILHPVCPAQLLRSMLSGPAQSMGRFGLWASLIRLKGPFETFIRVSFVGSLSQAQQIWAPLQSKRSPVKSWATETNFGSFGTVTQRNTYAHKSF